MSDDPQGTLLPIYLVLDDSGSMTGVLQELNDGLSSLLDGLYADSMAAAKVRLSVLSFSDTVLTHLDMADLRNVGAMPTMKARSTTSYKAAFDEIRSRIDRDVDGLRAQGFGVYRPAVFFLSDGQPTDDDPAWKASLDALRDPGFRRRPNIVAFGIGQADPATIGLVASKPEWGWQAARGVDTGKALVEFFKALTQSVVSSAHSVGAGETELTLTPPTDFKIAVDLV
jgi:uncharacterized protein YegL